MIFWLINKHYKWGPSSIFLEENVLYRQQFEVLVVLSCLLLLHSFNFLLKKEYCLILCYYQINCICNFSWKLSVAYNYIYISKLDICIKFCGESKIRIFAFWFWNTNVARYVNDSVSLFQNPFTSCIKNLNILRETNSV